MNGERIRIGVVGAGKMGVNHLRILREMDAVDLVGLYDTDTDRAAEAAEAFECRAFSDLHALGEEIDAACVVTPSTQLARSGTSLLNAGIHCLVEKPFATTRYEARQLIETAEKNSAIVMPGFVERFNPAVRAMHDVLSGLSGACALEARRMSAASGRIQDVDVVFDLLVHDLNIALSLMDEEIVDIVARGMTMHPSGGHDYVIATLSFADGSLANLTASRITHNKIRSLQISTAECMIDLNYITQEVRVSHQSDVQQPAMGRSGNYVLDLAVDQVLVTPSEPLMLELRHFVRCIQNNVQPEVTGADALRTLDIAWRIEDALSMARQASR